MTLDITAEMLIEILNAFGYSNAADLVQEIIDAGLDNTTTFDEVVDYLVGVGFERN